MSCFKLPDNLCDELTSMTQQFWWGKKKDEKKLAWVSWERMCQPKEIGSMGFRDLKSFNKALLAKQGWRLQTNTQSLFSRVFKAKYFPDSEFTEASLGKHPYFAWRSIMSAQTVVKKGRKWRVGNGKSIQIWFEDWLPSNSYPKILSTAHPPWEGTKVSTLIVEDLGEWNSEVVRQLFSVEEVDMILSIPLSKRLLEDRMVWSGTRNGKFSVSSAYHSIRELGNINKVECSDASGMKQLWKSIWNLNLPNKIRSFAWRACREALATKSNLKKRQITKDDICIQCGKEAETSLHLFWFCDRAKEVWSNSKTALPFSLDHRWYFIDVMWQLVKHSSICSDLMEKILSLCWEIWKERNSVRNGGGAREGKLLVRNATALVEEFRGVNERVAWTTPVCKPDGTLHTPLASN